MLSATNTIDDIKARLRPYPTYGYENTAEGLSEFEADLEIAISDAYKLDLIPVIGSSLYDSIAVKNKINLSEDEDYIYESELCFSISRFLSALANKERQHNMVTVESGIGSFSKTYSDLSSKDTASSDWFTKGWMFLKNAGYIKRRTISRMGIYSSYSYES